MWANDLFYLVMHTLSLISSANSSSSSSLGQSHSASVGSYVPVQEEIHSLKYFLKGNNNVRLSLSVESLYYTLPFDICARFS